MDTFEIECKQRIIEAGWSWTFRQIELAKYEKHLEKYYSGQITEL